MRTLLGQDQTGQYIYQCTCGAINTQKKRLTPKKCLLQCLECTDNRLGGGTDHPLYQGWHKYYKKFWPVFADFLLDVTPWPGPKYMLTGINGPGATPGNWQWVLKPLELFPIHYDTMTDFKGQFFDDALKHLHEEAHREFTIGPNTRTAFLAHLSRLEENSGIDPNIPIEKQQIQREKESQMFAIERNRAEDAKAHEEDRSSQTAPSRSIRNKLVPVLALRMEEHYKTAMRAATGTNLDQVHPLVEYVPWDVMAHITVTVVMDLLGKGTDYKTKLTAVYARIGERIDHQAFYEHIYRNDPTSWDKIDRWFLKDDVKGYTSKLNNARGLAQGHTYNFKGHMQHIAIGNWAWANLQSITNWFDVLRWFDGDNRQTYYMGLSRKGLEYAAGILQMRDECSYDCWPMITPPLDWELDKRGGYLKFHPTTGRMVRNNKGTTESTTPSAEAMAGLNKMQSVPFKINTFIYGIQKVLITKTHSIGTFKSYEYDSFKTTNYPLIDPAVWELPRVNDNVHPDIKAAKRLIKTFHKNAKKAEKEKSPPERCLRVAARFVNVPEFFLPAYMDSRTRMYYMVDTLNPQGADYQKALLLFAKGNPVTDTNREIVRADLLYTLANTWAGKVDGKNIKSDKLPEHERIEFGRKLVKEGKEAVNDPLSTGGMSFWTTADEPYQFLACLHEYYAIFEKKNKHVAEIPCGRDASNSGMQIQGGFLRDHTMCLHTNVIPTDVPMDAYEVVADEVRKLSLDKDWITAQMEKCKESAEANEKERQEKDPTYKMKDKNFTFEVAPEEVNRSILKRASMTTLYGAGWQSKFEYIEEGMDQQALALGKKYTLAEKITITNAQIIGQKEAFPASAAIDKWFRKLGSLVLKKDEKGHYVRWRTAAGSLCVQEYREPVTKRTNTYGMGGAKYFQILETDEGGPGDNTFSLSVQTGWGEVKESKTQTALAANWTHSQDASIIQLAFKDFPHSFFAVHDCGYAPAGVVSEMTMSLKDAYLKVVSSPVLDKLPEYNDVNLDPMDRGDVNIIDCLRSEYMFS